MNWPRIIALIGLLASGTGVARGQPAEATPTYRRIRAASDHWSAWPAGLPGLWRGLALP